MSITYILFFNYREIKICKAGIQKSMSKSMTVKKFKTSPRNSFQKLQRILVQSKASSHLPLIYLQFNRVQKSSRKSCSWHTSIHFATKIHGAVIIAWTLKVHSAPSYTGNLWIEFKSNYSLQRNLR